MIIITIFTKIYKGTNHKTHSQYCNSTTFIKKIRTKACLHHLSNIHLNYATD